jgi:hypothetical protein
MQNKAPVTAALRATFQFVGGRMSLLRIEAVDAVVPPSDPVSGYESQSGYWVTVIGKDGQVLYRRIMNSPVQFNPEVHEPTSTGMFSRRTTMIEPSSPCASELLPVSA